MKINQSCRHRTLDCQPLEMRRLLACDLTSGSAVAPPNPVAETESVVEDDVAPTTQNRSRASADISDGAQERPGRGWDASNAETASAIVDPMAVDIAIVAEDADPPETRSRARISDEFEESPGAHKRPGRGWDERVDEAASAIVRPVAADITIATDNSDPPETQTRGRISDEVEGSDGAHKRPGRGWD